MHEHEHLPKGLTYDRTLERFRIRFQSKTLRRPYFKWLPLGTETIVAIETMHRLRYQDKTGTLEPPEATSWSSTAAIATPSAPTLHEYAAEVYLPWCIDEAQNAPRTIDYKVEILLRIGDYWGHRPIDSITREVVRDYYRIRGQEVSRQTVDKEWGAVRHILRHAYSEGHLDTPPPQLLQPKRQGGKEPVFLTTQQRQDGLNHAHARGLVFYVTTLLLDRCGPRWGETAQLALEHVSFEMGQVYFPPRTAKHRRGRWLPLVSELAEPWQELALQYPDDATFALLRPWRGKWLPWREKDARVGGKVYPWQGDGSYLKVGPHVWRHTFGTRLLQEGKPLEEVSKLMGHSDVLVTSRFYSHVQTAAFTDTIEAGARPVAEALQHKERDERAASKGS